MVICRYGKNDISVQKNSAMPLPTIKSCHYCGCKEFYPLYEHVYDRLGASEEPWNFLECAECHAALLSPHPAADDLHRYYPENYCFPIFSEKSGFLRKCLTRIEFLLFRRWILKRKGKIIAAATQFHKKRGCVKLLDVACGAGDLLWEMHRRGYDVEGVDWSSKASEAVQKRMGIKVTSHDIGRIHEIYAPNQFDVITAFAILEHVLNPLECLAVWSSLLKPGGCLVIGVPLKDGVTANLFGKHNNNVTEAPRHVSLPTQRSIRMLVHRAEMEVISIHGESILECASGIALSLMSKLQCRKASNLEYLESVDYSSIAARLFMGMVAYVACPWIWFENYVLKKPFVAIIILRKKMS